MKSGMGAPRSPLTHNQVVLAAIQADRAITKAKISSADFLAGLPTDPHAAAVAALGETLAELRLLVEDLERREAGQPEKLLNARAKLSSWTRAWRLNR